MGWAESHASLFMSMARTADYRFCSGQRLLDTTGLVAPVLEQGTLWDRGRQILLMVDSMWLSMSIPFRNGIHVEESTRVSPVLG